MEQAFHVLRRELQEYRLAFEIIHHAEPIRSAIQGAEYFGIALGQTAPVLIVDTDQGFFAVVLSGDRGRMDLAALTSLIGCRRAAMAGRRDVQRVTGYSPGDLPLLGLDMPYIVDRRLETYPFIYGGTGYPGSTLKVEPAALFKINRVVNTMEAGDKDVL